VFFFGSGTAYAYRVRAFGGTATSDFSGVGQVTAVTTAPGGLSARAASATQVNLKWTDVTGDTGYAVERSGDGGLMWARDGTAAATW
jgi:hypothetical protein